MPNEIHLKEQDDTPAQIVFRDSTDFAPTAANDLRKGTPTLVQLDLTGVLDTAYRQSAKADLGATRAPAYAVRAALEFAATPVAGEPIYVYWAPSSSATAGTGNPGGASGADAAYTGYSSNGDSSANQLDLVAIGSVTVQVTTAVQIIELKGYLIPKERYGSLVFKNDSGASIHSDAVECHIVFDPILEEIQ